MHGTFRSTSEPVAAVVYGSPSLGRPFSQQLLFHPLEELSSQKGEHRPGFQLSPTGSPASLGRRVFYSSM